MQIRPISPVKPEPTRAQQEMAQCRVRVALVIAFLAYLVWLSGQPDIEGIADLRRGIVLTLCSVLISFGLIAANALDRPALAVRLGCAILHDVTFVSLAMYFGEAGSAPFAFVWVLVALVNGFRYGAGYLYYTAALSVLAFGAVYWSSDYWREQSILSVNLFFIIAVIPIYLGRLLRSLQSAKDELAVQASADPLTGLLNRSGFEAEVGLLMNSNQARAEHVLLFCDLDRFKDVNDRAGHAAGDKLLVDVANIIGKCARASDICGRLGGDEFCVVLRNCNLERGREIAESIRGAVAGYRLAWSNEYFGVGISVGVAPLSAVSDIASLIRLADAACYAAKHSGRNQIHVVDPRLDGYDTARVRRLRSG